MGLKANISFLIESVGRWLNRESLKKRYRSTRIRLLKPEANKRAFLVLGPESHGTHLVTDILLNAGCIGHAGNHVPWQPDNKELIRGIKKPWEYTFPTDLQPWDRQLPTVEDPIVWRRSIPHGKQWIDISDMINILKERHYAVHVVVVTRDPFSAIHSQLKWRHVKSLEKGKANVSRAYLHIFRHLSRSRTPYTLVSYESLASYPKAQDFLLEQIGLELPERRWPIYDGNRKWHDIKAEDTLADFPEGWYPCKAGHKGRYFEQVEKGYQKMKEQELIICGLARDVMQALPRTIARIERLGGKFKNYRVVIFENDSTDGTLEQLQYWQKVNERVEIISEKLGARKWGQVQDLGRMAQMATYRNRYLEHIREQQYQFDYLIVFDLDIPLGFSYDGIAHSFGYENWDLVGSNGILVPPYGDPIPNPIFYDAFAFRPKGNIPPKSLQKINALQFQRGEELVPVDSVFGGLTIYRAAGILAGAQYSGEDCEHVMLHQWLRENGFDKQFLNPSQIVLYSGRS